MKHHLALLACAALFLTGCSQSNNDWTKNEVIVMGMIHAGHRTSDTYGVDELTQIIENIDPDYILTEIPPDRFDQAMAEFTATGVIEEPRVRVFPEYTDVVFPLTKEMDFQIIPCAGWSKAMADDRREKLDRWKTERPAESAEVDAAMARADEEITALGWNDDPHGIHTDRYDQIVRRGMEPYDRLFNDDLGPGGWNNINWAHYALIYRALDEHRGEGKRILITFGSWHKYWLLDRLYERDDIILRSAAEFLKK